MDVDSDEKRHHRWRLWRDSRMYLKSSQPSHGSRVSMDLRLSLLRANALYLLITWYTFPVASFLLHWVNFLMNVDPARMGLFYKHRYMLSEKFSTASTVVILYSRRFPYKFPRVSNLITNFAIYGFLVNSSESSKFFFVHFQNLTALF